MLWLWLLVGLAAGVVVNGLADNLPPDALGVRRVSALPRCKFCGAAHRPAYWLALSAFVLRGGHCEHCGAPRRLRHVLVELGLALGLTGLWAWAAGDLAAFLRAALLAALFLLTAVIDIEHRLILRVVILPSALIVAALGMLSPERGTVKTLLGGLAGFALLLGLYWFGQLFTMVVGRLRRRQLDEVAFGGGDVNLGLVVGLAVGWPGVLLALVVAILAGGVYGLGHIAVQLLRRRYQPYAAIPYGPFLILGALLVYLFGQQFAGWYLGR